MESRGAAPTSPNHDDDDDDDGNDDDGDDGGNADGGTRYCMVGAEREPTSMSMAWLGDEAEATAEAAAGRGEVVAAPGPDPEPAYEAKADPAAGCVKPLPTSMEPLSLGQAEAAVAAEAGDERSMSDTNGSGEG